MARPVRISGRPALSASVACLAQGCVDFPSVDACRSAESEKIAVVRSPGDPVGRDEMPLGLRAPSGPGTRIRFLQLSRESPRGTAGDKPLRLLSLKVQATRPLLGRMSSRAAGSGPPAGRGVSREEAASRLQIGRRPRASARGRVRPWASRTAPLASSRRALPDNPDSTPGAKGPHRTLGYKTNRREEFGDGECRAVSLAWALQRAEAAGARGVSQEARPEFRGVETSQNSSLSLPRKRIRK